MILVQIGSSLFLLTSALLMTRRGLSDLRSGEASIRREFSLSFKRDLPTVQVDSWFVPTLGRSRLAAGILGAVGSGVALSAPMIGGLLWGLGMAIQLAMQMEARWLKVDRYKIL
ncbi:MAG: hypothetical protein GYB68_18445 [Chloroflexi bacterium]|nr:hypothetical protein [Chloroflexota bacterium]